MRKESLTAIRESLVPDHRHSEPQINVRFPPSLDIRLGGSAKDTTSGELVNHKPVEKSQ